MKEIAFYWSSKVIYNSGKGGGYFSLLVYRNALASQYTTTLIHYNELDRHTVLDDSVDILLLPTDTFISKYRQLDQYFRTKQPEGLLAFTSMPSTLLFRWMCWLHKSKFIYVRAGGPNYSLKQHYSNVLFFHKENQQALGGKKCGRSFLISNRVDPPQYNAARIEDFKSRHAIPADTLKVLRVSRVNQPYLPTFMAAIRQHEALLQRGTPVVTHLIGVVQNDEAYQTIKEAIQGIEGVELFTDDYYTVNTKELIPFYDVVIGIGRGFWEGVAYRKIVVGYASNVPLPVLITEDNIERFREYNCSPRVTLEQYVTYVEATDGLSKEPDWPEYQRILRRTFDEHFSSASLSSKLAKAIKESDSESLLKIVRSVYQVYRTYTVAMLSRLKHKIFSYFA